MEETTSQFLAEILKTYGLVGVVIVLFFVLLIVVIYKMGPHIIERWDERRKAEHDKKMRKSLVNGPHIQAVLREYREKVNCDHIFVGEFHNGSVSTNGIPYMKFDVIYEHVDSANHGKDVFLSELYENEHILAHDQIPNLLFQNHDLIYSIKDVEDLDEHLYLRMKSRGVKSIALSLILDDKDQPTAFVGGFNFDDSDINLVEMRKCADLIEKIYKE